MKRWCRDTQAGHAYRFPLFCSLVGELLAFFRIPARTCKVGEDYIDNHGGNEFLLRLQGDAALRIKMTRWFTPTADNLFGRISKAQTLAALEEAGKTVPDAPRLNKAELTKAAEKTLRSSDWLLAPCTLALRRQRELMVRNSDDKAKGITT